MLIRWQSMQQSFGAQRGCQFELLMRCLQRELCRQPLFESGLLVVCSKTMAIYDGQSFEQKAGLEPKSWLIAEQSLYKFFIIYANQASMVGVSFLMLDVAHSYFKSKVLIL